MFLGRCSRLDMGMPREEPVDDFRRRPATDALESLLQFGAGQVGDRPSTGAMWCAWRPHNPHMGFAQGGFVEGWIVLNEHAVEFADNGQIRPVLAEPHPNVLAAPRPGVRTQEVDTQVV
jgi:hypothetical protein